MHQDDAASATDAKDSWLMDRCWPSEQGSPATHVITRSELPHAVM